MRKRDTAIPKAAGLVAAAASVFALLLISQRNYLLFLGLTELFSVAVAFGIFMIAWNSRHLAPVTFVLVLGVAYLFVGLLDLLHTLAYEGMGVFPNARGSDLATQLWVAGRFVESSSLVLAFLLAKRRLRAGSLMAAYACVTGVLILLIFAWRAFPTCFDEQVGLTTFKKASEIAVVVVLAASLGLLSHRRRELDRWVLLWLSCSVVLTMASEVCFTLYRHSPYGFYAELGHFIKLASFYLIYKAMIETGLRRPYAVVFRDLERSRDELRKARDELEERVRERTTELSQTVAALETQMQQRATAQEQQRKSERRLFSVLNMLPGYVALIDRGYRIRFANHRFRQIFGEPGIRPCYVVQMGRDQPGPDCPIAEILKSRRAMDWEWTSPAGRVYRTWGYPFSDIDGTSVVLTLGLDVTAQKQLERQVIETSEAERRTIGRDLHDSLGQKLTALGLLAEGLSEQIRAACPERSQVAEQVIGLARDAVAEVRAMSRGLDPVGLEHGGLAASLIELARTTREQSGLSCDCHCDDGLTIDDDAVCMQLYRIAQEAVNNAVKHSQGSHIEIKLQREGPRITMTVTDDGRGVDKGRDEPGMGMHTMRYRASMIDGTLDVRPGAEGGTVVRCSAPMPAEAADGEPA